MEKSGTDHFNLGSAESRRWQNLLQSPGPLDPQYHKMFFWDNEELSLESPHAHNHLLPETLQALRLLAEIWEPSALTEGTGNCTDLQAVWVVICTMGSTLLSSATTISKKQQKASVS